MKTKFKHTKILEEANSESITFFFSFLLSFSCRWKTIQVTHGCDRENTMVLAVASADGKVMDPLIIFKGESLQSSWLGKNALKDTYFAVSESGWMTTTIFQDWFDNFIKK